MAGGDDGQLSLKVTDDLELRFHRYIPAGTELDTGPKPRYFEQVNRLTASAVLPETSVFVQVDEVALIGLPYLLDGERVSTPPTLLSACAGGAPCAFAPLGDRFYANPEKVNWSAKKGGLSWSLGDFYTSFGYGAALGLNRNVEIDIDTSIQGARLQYATGDWEFEGLGGQLNRQQVLQDNPNLDLNGDLRHAVAGVRATRYALGPATAGVHGVAYDFVEDPGMKPGFEELGTGPDTLIGGAVLELFGVAGVDWALEGDVYQHLDNHQESSPTGGHALYGSALFFLGATNWTVEAKRYKNAVGRVNEVTADELYQVVVPPTLEYERAINKDTSSAVSSNDISGGRVRMDIVAGAATPYLSGAVFRDADPENLIQAASVPETIVHGMAGAEILMEEVTVQANAGYRLDDRDGTRWEADRQLHGDFDIRFPIAGKFGGDTYLSWEQYQPGREPGGPDFAREHHLELVSAFTVQYGSMVAATLFVDYSTNPAAGGGGNVTEDTYMATEWTFRPDASWVIRAFYGVQKAGLKCSGGQCRTVPAFDGVKVAVGASF